MLDPKKSMRHPLVKSSPPLATNRVEQPSGAPEIDAAPITSGAQKRKLIGIISAVVAGLALNWCWATVRVEQKHANWDFVRQARDATAAAAASALIYRSPQGSMSVVSSLQMSEADVNRPLTQEFRAAWQSGDASQAAAIVQLQLADGRTSPASASSPLWQSVADGRAQFYHLFLADACFEDGDSVDLLVNREYWTTVKLSNRGITVPVPLSAGNNHVTLVGKQDGGGGITVLLQTSEGQFFCQPLSIGEEADFTAVWP